VEERSRRRAGLRLWCRAGVVLAGHSVAFLVVMPPAKGRANEGARDALSLARACHLTSPSLSLYLSL
jgi:hypothetical protein